MENVIFTKYKLPFNFQVHSNAFIFIGIININAALSIIVQ